MMDLRTRLSKGMGIDGIHEITNSIQGDNIQKQNLYNLVFDSDDKVAYQATWAFCHFSLKENKWLYDKQNELIDEVLVCKHGGKRRVLLNLLNKQPLADPPRVDFLDFCLERMMSSEELPGVKSFCMKIAYELCRPIPELMQELKTMLEMMEGDLCPAIRTVRRNTLKAMLKGKRLQKL